VSATRPYRNFAGDHLSHNLHHPVGHYQPTNQEIALHLRVPLPRFDPTDSWLVMLAELFFGPARLPRGRGIEKS